MVFSAGTNYWPWKIDDNEYQTHGADTRVQRMTTNILNTMIGSSPTPATSTPPAAATATHTPTTVAATSTARRTPTPGGATATPTTPAGGGSGAVLYDWETAGDVQGWKIAWTGVVGTPVQAAGTAHSGTGALRLPLSFSGSGWKDGSAELMMSSPANWSSLGTGLSTWVFLPAGAPSTIGATMYSQDPAWAWSEAPWVTLVPGQWTEVRWTNAPLTNRVNLGVQIGGSSVSYSGSVYIDQVSVIGGATAAASAIFAPDRTGPPAEKLSGSTAPTCSPRPEAPVTAVPAADGSLQVTVAARVAAGTPANALPAVRFGQSTNALIDAGGQIGSPGNFTAALPAGTQQTTFTVRRATAGQAVTVPLTVVDGCGEWPTFVGRGPW